MHKETQKEIEHRRLASESLSYEGRKYFNFIEFDTDEEMITEIRKDPFGLFLILLTGTFISVVSFIATMYLATVDFNSTLGGGNGYRSLFLLVGLFVVFGSVIMTLIAVFLYKSNVIFVTSEKLAQVLYTSLFNRKISQLSIGDVQDVTVTQKGILAHIFNYGTLVIETAGEQQNYTFSFVPDPYASSKIIVGAHERNLVKHGN